MCSKLTSVMQQQEQFINDVFGKNESGVKWKVEDSIQALMGQDIIVKLGKLFFSECEHVSIHLPPGNFERDLVQLAAKSQIPDAEFKEQEFSTYLMYTFSKVRMVEIFADHFRFEAFQEMTEGFDQPMHFVIYSGQHWKNQDMKMRPFCERTKHHILFIHSHRLISPLTSRLFPLRICRPITGWQSTFNKMITKKADPLISMSERFVLEFLTCTNFANFSSGDKMISFLSELRGPHSLLLQALYNFIHIYFTEDNNEWAVLQNPHLKTFLNSLVDLKLPEPTHSLMDQSSVKKAKTKGVLVEKSVPNSNYSQIRSQILQSLGHWLVFAKVASVSSTLPLCVKKLVTMKKDQMKSYLKKMKKNGLQLIYQ